VVVLPVIDIAPLIRGREIAAIASEIDAACRETGFFYVTGHGVAPELQARVYDAAREFFALPEDEKARVSMPHGGRAWRGWFPLEGELTSGVPDEKEGFYFGEELGLDDPRVRARLPLHGANLFPVRPSGMRDAVLEYMRAVTDVGHALLRAISVGLGLDESWFDRHLTASPTVLFRIFRYPPIVEAESNAIASNVEWSVGEHTDYGLITVLAQDDVDGLEVRGRDGWVAAPPIANSFVVNLGDMLERMTGGVYRSTPHRVRNTSGRERYSLPLFLDPAWDAEVLPVPQVAARADAREKASGGEFATDRWDGASVHEWSGTYGDYLLAKVSKVFPVLSDDVIV
jgi:isopenicillin N synthase-like dioxygenase